MIEENAPIEAAHRHLQEEQHGVATGLGCETEENLCDGGIADGAAEQNGITRVKSPLQRGVQDQTGKVIDGDGLGIRGCADNGQE